jgi:hypothetical protein
MSTAVRKGLLSDSEAMLRQVRGVLGDLAPDPDHGSDDGDRPAGLADLVKMLVTTYTEIMEVIESLRQSRGLLEQASMDRLRGTHVRLAEVTSATEVAATGMLDGIDRALGLVDALGTNGDAGGAEATKTALRQELHRIMDLLQFQDITSQQLGYASGVLFEVEQRMVQLSNLFDTGIGFARLDVGASAQNDDLPANVTCDPDASTLNAETRQALADEIFS